MQRSPFPGKQTGASLVELMIGLGILSIIGAFSAQFFSRLNRSDAEATARTNALSQLTAFANTIDRDLKFRAMPSGGAVDLPKLCDATFCATPAYSYKRLLKTGTTEVEYSVDISNSCVQMPANMRQRHSVDFLDLSPSGIDKIIKNIRTSDIGTSGTGTCLKAMKCRQDQLMQTALVPNFPGGISGKKPIYPPALPLPTVVKDKENASASKNIIAAATCASSTGTADRIILEAVLLQEDAIPRIERKEIILPRGNVANIQMLPN
jgi:type II secretory pathway pseudopilin PulG